MNYKNLLASGCSFTQDGIGGVPPTSQSAGGSSFKQYANVQPAPCASWASFLSTYLNVDSFVNFATSGGGNLLTCETIISALEKYNYQIDDTLVIFNITEFTRLDIKKNWDDKNDNIPWNSDYLDFTFTKKYDNLWRQKINELEIEEIISRSYCALEKLFKYLKVNNYSFVFTMMTDYSTNAIISQHTNNLVLLEPGGGMYEFCKTNNLLSDDNFHPSVQGHEQIAKQVYNFL
jgi:hypothetical protein